MALLNILCGGSAAALSGEGGVPPALIDILRDKLSYTHLRHLHGAASYDNLLGGRNHIQMERRDLFDIDQYGRVRFGLGFTDKVTGIAKDLGHTVELSYVDGWSKHPRPDRFEVNWSRIDLSKLRWRQEEVLRLIASGGMRTLITAPPGWGKTYLYGKLARIFHNARIHIIVDSLDIQERILRDIVHDVPDVGVINGKKKKFGRRLTLVSADSLRHVDGHDQISSRGADIVILEEVHRLAADSYVEPIARYHYARFVGSTATPTGRSDGSDARIECLCGPVKFSMSYQEAEEHGLVAPVMVEWIPVSGTSPCGKLTGTRREKVGIWRNQNRNQQIAERLHKFSDDTQVLVLVSTVEHAVELKQFLPNYKLCYDKLEPQRYASYVHNKMLDPADEPLMVPIRRRTMRTEFEQRKLMKVIATDVWSTGVDFTQLEVVCRADARAGEIVDYQGPGRVTRIHDGKEYGLIVDCMDNFDVSFRKRSMTRRRHYAQHGWKQIGIGAEKPGKAGTALGKTLVH